jgi:ABC-type transporter Mla subunit MlaD
MPRRLVVIAVLVLAAAWAATALLTIEDDGGGEEHPSYVVELDSAFGLTEGGEVKVGGVPRAGSVKEFRLDEEADPVKALVEIEITKPGFQRFRVDAGCDVRQQSLIGEYYLDCQPGRERQTLANGDRVKLKNNSSVIPTDLVSNIMRLPYRERFRLIISHLGAGLAGRPEELNEVIRRAHPGLRETTEVFEILADQNRVIRDFIRDSDQVSEEVFPRRRDLSRWARETAETTTVQASRRDDLARQWNRLPTYLNELKPASAQLGRTASRQIVALRELQDAAPALNRFLTELAPFSDASRVSTRALGQQAHTGIRVFRESFDEVRQLRALAKDSPRLAKPLRQLLQTLDDRSRSVEEDPLARRTAPPAPDKTAYRDGQGFTGYEAILNYVYYQTLAINAFDDIGHLLRIVLLQSRVCARYFNDPTIQERDRCAGRRLGPSSPNLYGQPDPTTDGTASRERSQRRQRVGYRGRGAPEAPPVPGERDISRPQIVLPPETQGLIDSLSGPDAPAPRGEQAPTALQTLDFLLAP